MDRHKAIARRLHVFGAGLIGAMLFAAPAQAQRTSLDTIDQKLNAIHQQLQQHDEDIKALLDMAMPDESKLVFVTSTLHDAALGGLAGADDICNQRAFDADLPGVYLAWLSTEFNSPSNRFNRATVPYVRTDGITVADDWIDLTDGTLRNPIRADEFGNAFLPIAPLPEASVWTNTRIDGTALSNTIDFNSCFGFVLANESDIARTGVMFEFLGGVSSFWTNRIDVSCARPLRLYCFEQ